MKHNSTSRPEGRNSARLGARIVVATVTTVLTLATSVAPAAAYVADGQRFVNNVNYCRYDASIPDSWMDSGALMRARSTWNGAGSPFRINYSSSAASYLCAAKRGTADAPVAIARHTAHPSAHNPKLHSSAKIEFNTSYPWSTSGGAGKFDVQAVATHELGHWVFLGDLYGSAHSEKTMSGSVALGETKKRSLHSDDVAGVNYVY